MSYLGLHDPAGNPLLVLDDGLSDGGPFVVTGVDLGAVDIPDDVAASPHGDGTLDWTANTGAAAVSITLTAVGDTTAGPQAWLDRLRGLCHPRRRLWLYVGIDDWPTMRRILVRGAGWPRDLTAVQPDAIFQWKAPMGYLENVDADVITLYPVAGPTPGLAFPIAFPLAFPAANPTQAVPFIVGGVMPTTATVDIYGPCNAPKITDAAGRIVAFTPALTIAAGHFVRVQPDAPGGVPLVAGDGDPLQPLYGLIDLSVSVPGLVLPLAPGPNEWIFTAAASSAGCYATVSFRERN